MAVGTVYLGTMMCKFGDDGKLISKEENKIDPNRPVIALTFDDGPGRPYRGTVGPAGEI